MGMFIKIKFIRYKGYFWLWINSQFKKTQLFAYLLKYPDIKNLIEYNSEQKNSKYLEFVGLQAQKNLEFVSLQTQQKL